MFTAAIDVPACREEMAIKLLINFSCIIVTLLGNSMHSYVYLCVCHFLIGYLYS